MIKWLGVALVVMASSAEAKPQRIVSANLCADQLVLALAEPERIAAISFNAKDSGISYYHERAQNFASIPENTEDIIRLKPDLAILTAYSSRAHQALLESQSIKVESLTMPTTLAEVTTQIAQVGTWLGEEKKAAALNADLSAAIARARGFAGKSASPRIAIFYQNGYSDGKDTLMDEMIRLVGGRNVAAETGISGMGYLPLEVLINDPPDLLLIDRYGNAAPTLGNKLFDHPALQKIPSINIRSNELICANHLLGHILHQMIDALETKEKSR